MRAGIALGSNLGDRRAHLSAAKAALARLVREPVLASAIYETEPVECAPDDPKFLNAVVELEWAGEALELLAKLREFEAAAGRAPEHPKNAPRTLDLDLLYLDSEIIHTETLELPHPRMTARRFVLAPLAEIRPELILPGQARTVAQLLAQLPATEGLVRVASRW